MPAPRTGPPRGLVDHLGEYAKPVAPNNTLGLDRYYKSADLLQLQVGGPPGGPGPWVLAPDPWVRHPSRLGQRGMRMHTCVSAKWLVRTGGEGEGHTRAPACLPACLPACTRPGLQARDYRVSKNEPQLYVMLLRYAR